MRIRIFEYVIKVISVFKRSKQVFSKIKKISSSYFYFYTKNGNYSTKKTDAMKNFNEEDENR